MKIIQIFVITSGDTGEMIYGLGNDSNVYQWSWRERKWYIASQ